MKTLLLGLLGLAALSCVGAAHAATYAGQSCQATLGTLTYGSSNARNNAATGAAITCPVTRNRDNTTGPVSPVVYFIEDGKSKTCYFDNFNIDTGNLGVWTSASGTRRLALPTLATTVLFHPLTFNCSLPAGSAVVGYYISE